MTPARVAAALAAMLTALLLQATLVGPVTMPEQLSLPAVLVAAVALQSGAGTGMSLGFATGLVADLGSAHPAGVLAACWLAVGVLCGLIIATGRPLMAQVALIGVVCGVAGSVATLLLTALGSSGATVEAAARALLPSTLGDVALALVVTPVVRWFLSSDALRAPTVRHG
jgi:cell shape-determining protein MreD